jgi:glycosyltransferase involved in cell wall biosynthesis
VPNDQIEEHYALIDLFVVPRIDDRAARLVTPLKPLEAMAMEVPVIAADLPALRELVAPGDRGDVFEPGDHESLAAMAGGLLEAEGERSRMVANAKTWILAERTFESNAVRYKEILGRVLDGT